MKCVGWEGDPSYQCVGPVVRNNHAIMFLEASRSWSRRGKVHARETARRMFFPHLEAPFFWTSVGPTSRAV